MLNKSLSLLALLLAPVFYLLYRLTKNQACVQMSIRCDPRYIRSLETNYTEKGGRGPVLLQLAQAFELAANAPVDCAQTIRALSCQSQSQLLQDIVVLVLNGQKRKGYFVEVGVGEGESISNTYLLEKQFGWTGLLVEPNKSFHASILAKRSATLVTKAAFSHSQLLLRFEAASVGEFSRLSIDNQRVHSQKLDSVYEVETATLNDLLSASNAPSWIDYISIDTEGSELAILQGLDFAIWKVGIFSIEHNYERAKSSAIHDLLSKAGYKRVLRDVMKYDAIYVHPSISEARRWP